MSCFLYPLELIDYSPKLNYRKKNRFRMNRFYTLRPGRISYRSGLVLQTELVARRLKEEADFLILLEHTPVVTLGRGVRSFSPLVPCDFFSRNGIDVVKVERGGDVTFHGPGQVVGYPIVKLDVVGRDLHLYLRMLEKVLLDVVAHLGVSARTVEGRTGIWVGEKKLASIGVAVRRWVSWHGFALNVRNDLSGFETIVPCGLEGVEMISLEEIIGRDISLETVEEELVHSFGRIFQAEYLGEYEYH